MARVFQGGPEPKDPRLRESPYLEWIATTTCCVACLRLRGRMNREVQVAHIRFSDSATGWKNPGMQAKSDDRRTVGLCMMCHTGGKNAQHATSERGWWDAMGIDVNALVADLNDAFDAGKPGIPIIARHVGLARRANG